MRFLKLFPWLLACGALWLAACSTVLPAPTPTPAAVSVTFIVDGLAQTQTLASTLTVREALVVAGLTVGDLDRVTPPPYTRLTEGLVIKIVRVTEKFETEQRTIPFTSQTVKNESLPEGERRLLQAGASGVEELTYRTVFEDGVQIARNVVKQVTLTAPTPEIIMLGSQGSFTLVPISGTLVYLNGQNAWVMRRNSGQRLPLTTSGDLDGFVLTLSPDSQWLLFSRAAPSDDPETFNTLWVLNTLSPTQVLSLPVTNALYAEWWGERPNTILYSNATKIPRAPGWQANNNLWTMTWNLVLTRTAPNTPLRSVLGYTPTQLIDTSSGGPYGWWGTGFALAPDGETLAYARTDSIGLWTLAHDLTTQQPIVIGPTELAQFTAYNTRSDWAWYPNLHWAPDGAFLFTNVHGAPIGLEAPEDSPAFDFVALSRTGQKFPLVPRAGIFANPLPAPIANFPVAYLQAADPNNSPFSTYRLSVMDRDGSNARQLFPPADLPGLRPNEGLAWSPDGARLAVIYNGNLWIVDLASGLAQQLTGDGLSAQPVWGE